MSIISIQLGQCGNQLSHETLKTIYQEALISPPALQSLALQTFFTPDSRDQTWQAKAVLADMEPKVVQACLNDKNIEWNYDPSLSFWKQEGSGNNWGFGYQVHGPKCESFIMDKVRRSLEESDYTSGLILYSSLAGGTGSGLGAYITQKVKENYPEYQLYNISIWPHQVGEVIVQSYNAILSLSNLYEQSDGLILFFNDKVHKMCTKNLGISKPNFVHFNQLISHFITSTIYPTLNSDQQEIKIRLSEGLSFLTDLFANPLYKLATINSVPIMPRQCKEFTADTWQGVIKQLRSETKTFKILSQIQFLRGYQVYNPEVDQIVKQEFGDTQWRRDLYQLNGYEKQASMVLNSNSVAKELDQLASKAWNMFSSKAYLHHYSKYGLNEDYFTDFVFPNMEQIVFNYKQL